MQSSENQNRFFQHMTPPTLPLAAVLHLLQVTILLDLWSFCRVSKLDTMAHWHIASIFLCHVFFLITVICISEPPSFSWMRRRKEKLILTWLCVQTKSSDWWQELFLSLLLLFALSGSHSASLCTTNIVKSLFRWVKMGVDPDCPRFQSVAQICAVLPRRSSFFALVVL